MGGFILRRIAFTLPVLVGLSVIVFIYIHLIPGDPVAAMLGRDATPELIAALRGELGLDRPLLVQYVDWVADLLRGDLGTSLRTRQEIGPFLWSRIPATLELALAALLIGSVIAIPTGILAGLRKNSRTDLTVSLVALIGYSMPVFWTGFLFILIFAVTFRLLPSQGYTPLLTDPVANVRYLLMPATVLGLLFAPLMARMIRTVIIETVAEPFNYAAHAKGLRDPTIMKRYVVRPALASVIVVFGLNFAALLSGAIIVEEMFNWPGVGRVIIRAVLERDYLVVQATILVYAAVFIVINLFVEILQAWLDPRIQLT